MSITGTPVYISPGGVCNGTIQPSDKTYRTWREAERNPLMVGTDQVTAGVYTWQGEQWISIHIGASHMPFQGLVPENMTPGELIEWIREIVAAWVERDTVTERCDECGENERKNSFRNGMCSPCAQEEDYENEGDGWFDAWDDGVEFEYPEYEGYDSDLMNEY